jgi:O-antigen/teichoic acid export membrane protein
MVRSSLLSLVDQGIWALTNFVAVALAARTLDHPSFGAFSICFSIMVLASGLSTSMGAEVLGVTRGILLREGSRADAVEPYVRRALGVTAEFAGLGTIFVALVLLLAARDTSAGVSTWWMVAVTPFSVISEGLRAMHYAQRRIRLAFGMSATWIVTQGASLGTGVALRGLDASTVFASWGIGALACSVVGAVTMGTRGAFRGAARQERRRRLSYGFEYLATAAPPQLLAIIAAATLGVVAAGAVRALQTVYGPLNVVLLGLRNAIVPAVTEQFDPRSSLRAAGLVAVFAAAITVALTAVLVVMPSLGQLLMGSNWPSDISLLGGYGIGRLAASIVFGALVLFRATDLYRISVPLRIGSAAALVVPFALFVNYSLADAMWASGVTSLAVAAIWWTIAAVRIRPVARNDEVSRDQSTLE